MQQFYAIKVESALVIEAKIIYRAIICNISMHFIPCFTITMYMTDIHTCTVYVCKQ